MSGKPFLLFGTSAGVAIVKIPNLINRLARQYDVHVIMTKHATQMIPPDIFQKASSNPVAYDILGDRFDYTAIKQSKSIQHIELATKATLLVIAPATANIIAKLAHGIADDYLTTTALAATCPILLVPSMNTNMWKHPSTIDNIKILQKRGVHTFGPDSGMLACGTTGDGRLPEVDAIESEIMTWMHRAEELRGVNVLVTAGGTAEPIDDIRVITNKSSGKMGVAFAEELFVRGANVTLLRGETSERPRLGIRELLFNTTEDLQQHMDRLIPLQQICIHTAAISDFFVKQKQKGKLSSDAAFHLTLVPKIKLLDNIKQQNPTILLVACKAEYAVSDDTLIRAAQTRLRKARADFIIANDVGRPGIGFSSDENEVYLIDKKGDIRHLPKMPKRYIAREIVSVITNQLRQDR